MIANRLKTIRENIRKASERAGRDPDSVRLIAVSKTVPDRILRDAMKTGLRVFGENKIQEALKKITSINDKSIEWHFIGRLQGNKVKFVPGVFKCVHSLDRVDVAEKLSLASLKKNTQTEVLVQVNLSNELTKAGINPDELPSFISEVSSYPGVRVQGLMTLPPKQDDPEASRPYFRVMNELKDKMNRSLNLDMKELSMGMSNDYAIAVEEGATWIRVGSALFGQRDKASV